MKQITFKHLLAMYIINKWHDFVGEETKTRPTRHGVRLQMKNYWEVESIPATYGYIHRDVYLFEADAIEPLVEAGYIRRSERYKRGGHPVYELLLTTEGKAVLTDLIRICGVHWSHWPLSVPIKSGVVSWSNAHFMGQ